MPPVVAFHQRHQRPKEVIVVFVVVGLTFPELSPNFSRLLLEGVETDVTAFVIIRLPIEGSRFPCEAEVGVDIFARPIACNKNVWKFQFYLKLL